jgi:hypothetical protein
MTAKIVIDDDTKILAQLGEITPKTRKALVEAVTPLAKRIAGDAQSRAAAHIRFQGKTPGAYLASIYGGVASKENRVVGFVRSGHPLAHLLEYGATTPPHKIAASVAKMLKFTGSAGEVYARFVNHPGASIPAYPAINPAFEAAADDARATIEGAVKGAASRK